MRRHAVTISLAFDADEGSTNEATIHARQPFGFHTPTEMAQDTSARAPRIGISIHGVA
jgi:hypothetical protein